MKTLDLFEQAIGLHRKEQMTMANDIYTEVTDVLFLIELPNEDTPCDLFAYFPNEPYNTTPNLKSGYVHLGQHTAIHTEYANECIKATPEQYQDLKRELEQIGYNLNVLN